MLKKSDTYFTPLRNRGITFKLMDGVPEKNSYKYQLSCSKPIDEMESIDNLFRELYRLVGDLVLDGYHVEIVDGFNLLIKKLPD